MITESVDGVHRPGRPNRPDHHVTHLGESLCYQSSDERDIDVDLVGVQPVGARREILGRRAWHGYMMTCDCARSQE